MTAHTVAVLTTWLAGRGPAGADPLFATRRGTPLSHDAVSRLVAKHTASAARTCLSLTAKHVTPHTLRHTAAMNLLHAGVDITIIALWLGHESPTTTRIYLHADMALKEQAIARATLISTQRTSRYTAPERRTPTEPNGGFSRRGTTARSS